MLEFMAGTLFAGFGLLLFLIGLTLLVLKLLGWTLEINLTKEVDDVTDQ